MQRVLVLIILLSISFTSCRKDFSSEPSNGTLEFSKKRVYLDTVFTGIASSTYQLKVYNRSNNDISIPSVALNKGNNSKYRLMVDGMSGEGGKGKYFKNVEILAHDSIYVFIEETADIIDANSNDFLYTDEILFDSGSNQQKVDLITLIQDAHFLFPDRIPNGQGGYTYENLTLDNTDPTSKIYGFPLTGSELHFTNQKPYVIYGYAGVEAGDILKIDPGARIYFHDQSGIFVKKGGTIQAIGDFSPTNKPLEKEIIFEGDRLEPNFSEIPGQWGIIYLADGSTNNIFNHVTIKNSTVGIFVDRQDATTVQIKNTQIYNSSNYGIVARKGKINGENIVVNRSGKSSLACILGGDYSFTHCTFANYWTGGSRQTPAVYLDNTYFEKNNNTLYVSTMQVNFTNSIIFGSNNIELLFNRDNSAAFTYSIVNSLIRFNDPTNQYSSNSLYTPFLNNSTNLISNNSNYNDPKFKNSSKNQMWIIQNSSVIAKGNPLVTQLKDINGNDRPLSPTKPDLGAYNYVP